MMQSIREFIIGFNYFILFYVISINSIYFIQLILASFSLSDYIKKMLYSDYRNYASSDNMIPISILVPAYNEEETIVENVRSLLSLNYPFFEVIVINDGSKDKTLQKLIDAYNLKPVNQPIRNKIKTQKIIGVYRNIDILNLIVIDKDNGGKSDALNSGINISRFPIFAAIDADSILESDSLVKIIMPFVENKDVIAVGGIVRIANGSIIKNGVVEEIRLPEKAVPMFQIIEYLRAFLTGRMGWDSLGALLIISGAFGAFRKAEVMEVGGYTTGTIGEDMELVIKLHEHMTNNKRKYKIKFIPDPVCWTQAPETLKDLKSQRRRWQIGLMDSLFKHKKMFLNPKYGKIGMIGAPYFWVFEMMGPAVEITGYILIPLSYVFGALNIRFFILFLTASILYGIILSLSAILLEEYTFNKYPSIKQIARLTWYGVLENFGFRQLVTLYRLQGIFRYRKNRYSWDKFQRKTFN
jgi:cellulose synthase/poly-beta-1,6-N-acetylglucosamine synthase-like glycosyltransferase